MWLNIFAVIVCAFLIYCCVIIGYTMRLKQIAYVLLELLDGQWGDMVKIIRNEEYVEAVMIACEKVLEAG